MHSNEYSRTIIRCFWWALAGVVAGFVLNILPYDLAPVFGTLVLVAAGVLLFRATYYLGRYEERESGGDQQWGIFDNDPSDSQE